MSTYATPPKVRGYFTHWPESGDMKRQSDLTRRRTYVDHYPKTGDIRTTRQYINSYLDHTPHPGDTRLQ